MSIRLKLGVPFLLLAGARILAFGQPLASGQWGKFSVVADGIYKIDYSLLKKAGFDPDQIDPRQLHLFGNGTGMLPQPNSTPRQNQLTELAVFVSGEADGKFDKGDYLLFFGQGPDEYHFEVSKNSFEYTKNIYSDQNFYFLTVNAAAGRRTGSSENKSGTYPVIDQYTDFGYYESDKYNILTSGREWFGDQFGGSSSLSLQFNMEGVLENSPIVFISHVMATSFDSPSSFQVFFNNIQIDKQDITNVDNSQYAIKGVENSDTVIITSTAVSATAQNVQTIKYQYNAAATGVSIGYLDYLLFSIKRKLVFLSTPLLFTTPESQVNPVSDFSIAGLPSSGVIWDVTDPLAPKIQNFDFSSNHVSFSVATDTLKRFIAFNADDAVLPVYETQVPNQNLSSLPTPDLLIVTHPDFLPQASRLAAFRQSHNGLTTQVVTVQQIYNEYSGGKQDVTAIRDFVKDMHDRGGLDNLLLFGRCSYDYKSRVLANTNFVPTYESRNSLSPLETYSSDDYFAFLEPGEGEWPEDPAQDYSMEIGVGRISVITADQAKTVVDKLIDYETNSGRFGAWRKDILFVADDGDYNIHQGSADALATYIDTTHAEFTTKKIYLDQYKQITKPSGQYSPDAKDALSRALEEGSFIVNYTGHGSENVWAQEQILDHESVVDLKNAPRYPLFVTATCVFGRHDDPFQLSSGELLLLQPGGGGIGLITTARPVNSSTNQELNLAFYSALFTKTNGSYRDIGAIFRDTKNNSLSGVANRNFSLIGDPSMHLVFARDSIVITSVTTTSNSDTLKALSTVAVRGEVQRDGVKVSGFNGDANITLFDRPVPFLTKGDENPPFSYKQWSNALFRGNVQVLSGSFSADFIVPGDIEPSVGTGKITTYAFSATEDASGAYKSEIGGVEHPAPLQDAGPSMKLFIGDTTFINGGIASPNTTLVVRLNAKNGVNISEVGEASNFTAILDDSLTYDLSPYYVATSGDSIGSAIFPLLGLSRGRHSVTVNASDVFGNPVTGIVTFVVTDQNLQISTFYNYPNPFSSPATTTFVFSHNRPGEDLEADLSIFDLAGAAILDKQFLIPNSLTEVTLADWDGTTFAGNKIRSGVYLAKVSVRSLLDGSKNEHFTKLIIVN